MVRRTETSKRRNVETSKISIEISTDGSEQRADSPEPTHRVCTVSHVTPTSPLHSSPGRSTRSSRPFDVSTCRRFGVSRRRGLTLIETALATIIIGVGVLAIVVAQQSFHNQNAWSNRAATATRLGNEIRELTFNLPRHDPVTGTLHWGPEPNELSPSDFDDIDDFDGQVFSAADGSGPLNARREIIPNMAGWAQIVQVDMVDPFDINHVFDVPDTPEDYPAHYLMRVQVIVTFQQGTAEAEEVTRVSWIAPN